MLELLSSNLASAAMQILTGKLLNQKQIDVLSSSIVGRVFSDWLPPSGDRRRVVERVDDARKHIESASEIVANLRSELDAQVAQLQDVVKAVEEKKARVAEYEALLQATGPTVDALRNQLEGAVRRELLAQSEQGRRLRQVLGAVSWLAALYLGAHWNAIEAWVKSFL